jgi:hypothetical protein
MTRIEESFPPDIVAAVYARLERETRRDAPAKKPASIDNVISLEEYRKRVSERCQ